MGVKINRGSVIFRDRPMFSHNNEKFSVLAEAISMIWLNIGHVQNWARYALLPYFLQDTDRCSATSMESSRWDDLNDIAEHLSPKMRKIRTYLLFFRADQRSATSIASSRRDNFNHTAEHRSIFKRDQNTHYSLIFLDGRMFIHINGKISPRPFKWYGWT